MTWAQFSVFLLAGIVFISILLGNKNTHAALVIKTMLLFVLVSLLVAGGEISWVCDTLDQASSMFAGQTQVLDKRQDPSRKDHTERASMDALHILDLVLPHCFMAGIGQIGTG